MAKEKPYTELNVSLDTKHGERDLYQPARQRHPAGKDGQQLKVIKGGNGNVLRNEEGGSTLKGRRGWRANSGVICHTRIAASAKGKL